MSNLGSFRLQLEDAILDVQELARLACAGDIPPMAAVCVTSARRDLERAEEALDAAKKQRTAG